MKNILNKQILSVIIAIILSGCGPSMEMIQNKMINATGSCTQAQIVFKQAKQLATIEDEYAKLTNPEESSKVVDLEKKYSKRLQEASEKLKYLKKAEIKDKKAAYLSAKTTQKICQKIIEQIGKEFERFDNSIYKYEQDTVKNEIQQIEKIEDSENPLIKDYLEPLCNILGSSRKTISDPQRIKEIIENLRKIKEEIRVKDSLKTIVLQTDTFELGRYELSEHGKYILRNDCQKIIGVADKEKTVTIRIKVDGYTDEVGFREGDSLINELIEGVEYEVPQYDPERRQYLNKRLSEFRARNVGKYVKHFFLEYKKENPNIKVEEPETSGHGEEIPDGISNPQREDPDRRICKIYIYKI
ncbi:hypothetical protein QUF80_01010 [Desulfococcaceae bacterium HSG8]|nr:hypothetical protein [Desulfococcaceae bacterium HSG8]